MPDTPFTTHDTDAVALNRNITPIPECKVYPGLRDGEKVDCVRVKILDPAAVWLRCQQEAEQWVTDAASGKPLSRPDAINRRINSAYAFLWLRDRRFQWAGLAAFASKQVGCGLLHASTMLKEAHDRVLANPDFLDVGSGGEAVGAYTMYGKLALGNLSLFLDIYPLHRFYMLRGLEALRSSLQYRRDIKDKVRWPEEAKKRLEFGYPFAEIIRGFEAIENGDIQTSVERLARHEQVNILQKVIYNDKDTRLALDANQFAWVHGLRGAAEIQLTLSAQCKPNGTFTSWLPRLTSVHLWDENDRMDFVIRTARQFNLLLKSSARPLVEKAISDIHHGGGVS
ncbi:MAG TPA: hypothetical protein DDX04_12635 [Massilia sp.]|nr:hypothetical protein [Massilia sp.]